MNANWNRANWAKIIAHQSKTYKDLSSYTISWKCTIGLGKLFFLVQIYSEGLHKNSLAKLLKIDSLCSETSLGSYNIFYPTLTHLKKLHRLGFLCN